VRDACASPEKRGHTMVESLFDIAASRGDLAARLFDIEFTGLV
jgi:hypothetical protein